MLLINLPANFLRTRPFPRVHALQVRTALLPSLLRTLRPSRSILRGWKAIWVAREAPVAPTTLLG